MSTAWFVPIQPVPEKPIERRLAEAGIILNPEAPAPQPIPHLVPLSRR